MILHDGDINVTLNTLPLVNASLYKRGCVNGPDKKDRGEEVLWEQWHLGG